MCGIAGIKTYKSKIVNRDTIVRMTDSMKHRGPDDKGIYISPEGKVALGHRRLSILDLSPTGHQPMTTEDGEISLVMNGEIYNHEDIKKELLSLGYNFRGHSDTETVLYAYQQWGDEIFVKLNGIFSMAISRLSTDTLTLVRDRLGVKPLYYTYGNSSLLFASELKAILAVEHFDKITPQSLHEFLYFGYAMKDRTMFDGIYEVLPGEKIIVQGEEIRKSLYWKPEDIVRMPDIQERDAIEKTRDLLEKAVVRQLMADVPVGVFLSGGIDSGAMVAFASKHYGGKIKTYSAGFDFDGGHNELPLAAKVAGTFDTEHHELMIKGGDLPDIIEKLVWHHDTPFSDAANIPLYLMTQALKGSPKVILQGDGGDEMFGGYPGYHLMSKYWKYKIITASLHPFHKMIPVKRIQQQVERFYPLFAEKDQASFYGRLLTTETPENSPLRVLNPGVRESIIYHNPFFYFGEMAKRFSFLESRAQKLLWIDTQILLPYQFLEKVDKSTMANSIEVRVPFLDNELSAFAMGLPAKLKLKGGVKKYLLKKALVGILPNEVLYGPKKGFGVPYQNWLAGPLYVYMRERILGYAEEHPGFFNKPVLEKMMTQHKEGKGNAGFLLWKVLNLVIWMDKYSMDNG